MIWDRSETIALAKQFCTTCQGEGHKAIRKGHSHAMQLRIAHHLSRLLRALRHLRHQGEIHGSQITLVPCKGKESVRAFARL